MSEETAGKCFICKKEITRHDISHKEEGQEYNTAYYYERWPGDHVCCSNHPGVVAEYEAALLEGAVHVKNKEPS